MATLTAVTADQGGNWAGLRRAWAPVGDRDAVENKVYRVGSVLIPLRKGQL